MTKFYKKISAPLISLILLLNMSSAGMAETTVSAEVGFIFNTLLFLICVSWSCLWLQDLQCWSQEWLHQKVYLLSVQKI